MHFTPTSSSWLNLVERFFGELTSEVVRGGSFQSLRELVRAIESYLAERNQNPKKYVWRASGLRILEKIQRAKEALAAAEVIITSLRDMTLAQLKRTPNSSPNRLRQGMARPLATLCAELEGGKDPGKIHTD